MLVHEFITPKTSDVRHAANARDLERFVSRLSRGADDSIPVGQLQGPYVVPGMPLFENPPLYLLARYSATCGKASVLAREINVGRFG